MVIAIKMYVFIPKGLANNRMQVTPSSEIFLEVDFATLSESLGIGVFGAPDAEALG